ncbi:MAG TPA: DUF3617 family protein [Casimicrobiaceae bacterium]|nr:DUF3617 family protein [Casimicrobiaceae bacterium]
MRIPALLLCLAAASAPPAAAQDYPKLKPGQWEVTTTSNRSGTPTPSKITLCTDDAVQKQMMDMGKGMSKEMCSKFELRRDGSRYVGESVCKIGDSTLTSHSVMTVQGDTAYKTVVNATYDPPFMGMKDTSTSVEGRHVGACADGMKPGDVVTATGQKFNMMSMPARPAVVPPAKAAPRPPQ